MIENHSKFWVCLRRNFLFTPKTFGRLSTADQSHVMSVASDPAPSGWKSHLRGLSPFLSFPKAFPLAQGQFLSPHCVASALHRQPPAHWTSPIPKPRRDPQVIPGPPRPAPEFHPPTGHTGPQKTLAALHGHCSLPASEVPAPGPQSSAGDVQ